MAAGLPQLLGARMTLQLGRERQVRAEKVDESQMMAGVPDSVEIVGRRSAYTPRDAFGFSGMTPPRHV